MECGEFLLAGAAQAAHELEQAAGICGDDGGGVGGEEMRDFSVAELLRGLGLEQVVDARGAAAERGFGDLGDFKAGDLREQLARLLMDALRVAEVAGVVVGDAERQGIARCDWVEFAEDFGDVFAFCGEGAGSVGPLRVVAQEMAVLLHGGTAAGGVDDDGVDVGAIEEVDDLARHCGGLLFQPGVDHESSAAGLILGSDDFAAFRGEHARGGGVDVGEEDLLHASGEHSDAAAGGCGGDRIW